MTDQYVCGHGHAYYDGDRGVGDPYQDGMHDAMCHVHDDGVRDWEPWERDEYERGFEHGEAEARTT